MILREPALALDGRMRTVWAVEGAIMTAVLAAAVALAVALLLVGGDSATVAFAVGVGGAVALVATGVVLIWLLPIHYHRRFRYEVTALGLYVARGWLWRRWQVVPHARIETVDLKSGPILRSFGLIAVHVATAAAGGGTEIPGLTPEVADELVEELAKRAPSEAGA